VPIEAFLAEWMVESGDFPELHVGQDTKMSLGAHVRSLDGVGEVPDSGTLLSGGPTRDIAGTVTWVQRGDRGPHLVVRHEDALLAAEPAMCQGPRRPTWWDRVRGRRGTPDFLPVQLPVPDVGQSVTLECTVGVMADYELEEMWPGPDVSGRYRVELIHAVLLTPQPMPSDADEFDVIPFPPSRTIGGLTSTRPPPGFIEFDFTDEGEGIGEHLDGYRLLLTPVDHL
jgi:hypothetical protein